MVIYTMCQQGFMFCITMRHDLVISKNDPRSSCDINFNVTMTSLAFDVRLFSRCEIKFSHMGKNRKL